MTGGLPSPTSTHAGVEALARLLDLRDGYTALHAERAARLAAAVGERLGIAGRDADVLRSAARLHDLGKVGIPDKILHKPERLDADEWALMRCHPAWGAEILAGMGLGEAARLVRSHHERWDGRGYPDGLAGEDVPAPSLIIGACEAYTSLTADRPFRAALPPERAQQVLRAGAGSHFAPRIVAALLDVLAETPDDGVEVPEPRGPRVTPRRASGAGPGAGLRGLLPAMARVHLPALAESRQRLVDLARAPQPSPRRMVAVIETDPGLTAAVVGAASADAPEITGVSDAVQRLGASAVAEIAHETPTFDFFNLVRRGRVPPEPFRLHAIETRRTVRRLAKVLDHPEPGRLALAALLHDVGKLVLAEALPGYPDEVHGPARTPEQRVHAERRALGVDHASVGAILLGRWGIGKQITGIVAAHHDEQGVGDGAVLRLADLLAHYSAGTAVDPAQLLAAGRLARLGSTDLRAVMFDLHEPAASASAAPDYAAEPSPLSVRETEALRGLADGLTYTQIAERSGVSPSTVRSHLHNAYGKLGVADRAQAVLVATERGWV